MADRVNKTLDGLVGPADWLDDGVHVELLETGERPKYALSSTDGIEHTTEGRSTSITPMGDHDSYLLVTDRRILVVLGDQPTDPELEFPFVNVTDCSIESGLLSSSVTISTRSEAIEFSPSAGNAEATVEFASETASNWREVGRLLGEARQSIEQIEAGLDTSEYEVKEARTRITEARKTIEGIDDVPTEALQSHVREVESELEAARTDTWLHEAQDIFEEVADELDAAAATLGADQYEQACEAILDAGDRLEAGYSALEKVDGQSAGETLARANDLETRIAETVADYLDTALTQCERARTAADPDDRVRAWAIARDWYVEALDADLSEWGDVTDDTLEFQLTWVRGALIDARIEKAVALEAEGDGCDDDETALECYETALDVLEETEALTTEHPHQSTAPIEAPRERINDKQLDATEWEWGSPGTDD